MPDIFKEPFIVLQMISVFFIQFIQKKLLKKVGNYKVIVTKSWSLLKPQLKIPQVIEKKQSYSRRHGSVKTSKMSHNAAKFYLFKVSNRNTKKKIRNMFKVFLVFLLFILNR